MSETIIEEKDKLQVIEEALAELKFGELHITIHEGQIVQISRIDKKRYTVK